MISVSGGISAKGQGEAQAVFQRIMTFAQRADAG
jgi:hypothetical protein